MDRDRIIEEMVSDMGEWAIENNMCWNSKHAESLSNVLIDKGYRRPPAGAVVLTREELETTEKFHRRLKTFISGLLKLKKSYPAKKRRGRYYFRYTNFAKSVGR